MELVATINDMNDDGYVRCVITDGEGVEQKRRSLRLRLDDFITALSSNIGAEKMYPIDLPDGYISASMGNCAGGLTGQISFKVEAQKRLITYCGETFFIPIPSLVFDFTFTHGKLVKDSVRAINAKGSLCMYPFTNVYRDGHICWGSAKIGRIASFKEAVDIAELFLRFPMNSDLSNSSTLRKAKVGSMGELFKLLENKDKFPEKFLTTL